MWDIIDDIMTYGLAIIASVLCILFSLVVCADRNEMLKTRTKGEVVQTFKTDGYTYKVVRE